MASQNIIKKQFSLKAMELSEVCIILLKHGEDGRKFIKVQGSNLKQLAFAHRVSHVLYHQNLMSVFHVRGVSLDKLDFSLFIYRIKVFLPRIKLNGSFYILLKLNLLTLGFSFNYSQVCKYIYLLTYCKYVNLVSCAHGDNNSYLFYIIPLSLCIRIKLRGKNYRCVVSQWRIQSLVLREDLTTHYTV